MILTVAGAGAMGLVSRKEGSTSLLLMVSKM